MPPEQGNADENKQELEGQYKLLAKYQQLLMLATDPIEQKNCEYRISLIRKNIKRLERGQKALPLPWEDVQPKNTLRCPQPPAPPEQFGGRGKELEELKQKLKADELVALTSLNGLGGIGKTTLARKLAHDLYHEQGSERCFRAVLWADVTQQPDEGRLLESLGKLADPNFSRQPDEELPNLAGRVGRTVQMAIEQECAVCEPNRVLLVLDDVWENNDGVEIARRLLKVLRSDTTTVLITTRSAKVAAKLGVSQRNKQEITKLEPEEGAALLREFLEDAPQEALLELSAALGGYTIALKLAAQRLNAEMHPLGEISGHIKQYREELPAGTEFAQLELEQGDEKEENLTKTLYYSYAALEAEEQAYFRALGAIAHGQPFDLQMLSALWQLSEEDAKEKAKRFWHLGLLEPELARYDSGIAYDSGVTYGGTRPGWYRLHPVLQSYALALLKRDEAEQTAAIARYQDYVIEVASQFNKLPPEEWGQLNPYLPHIHAVGAALVKATAEAEEEEALQRRALNFARNTYRYLFNRREVREVSWLEMGLKASRYLQDQNRESLFLSELGLFYSDLGEKAKALEYYNEALPLRRAVGDRSGEANTLSNIGAVYDALGEKDKALEYYNEALPLRRAVRDKYGEAVTLNNIGMVLWQQREREQALRLVEQAQALFEYVRSPNAQVVAGYVAQMRAILEGK